MDQIGFSRRVFVLLAGITAVQSLANAQQANGIRGGGMTEQQKMLIPSLPVFPWLSIAETKKTQVRSPIQSLISSHQGYVMVTDGQSVETGGAFINLATSSKQGLLGIDGCSMINLDFGPDETAQLVSLSIDRGWRNKNVQPLISSLTGRYAAITPPIFIRDGESEATDATALFDIGRFVVEALIPQHGTLLTVNFTTKDLLAKLRTADRTIDLIRPYLQIPSRPTSAKS
jgi:hypothetical protein